MENLLEQLRTIPVIGLLFEGSGVIIFIKVLAILIVIVVIQSIVSYFRGSKDREKSNLLRRLVSQGNYLQAGNIHFKDNNNLGALKMYTHGKHWDKAALVYTRMGDPMKAGECYEKVQAYASAARSYQEAEDDIKAAGCFQRCKSKKDQKKAAKIYEREKEFQQAAEIYEAIEDFEKAAAMYGLSHRSENEELIAKMYEAGFKKVNEDIKKNGATPEKEEKRKELAHKAAKAYEKMGEEKTAHKHMAIYFMDTGERLQAAESLLKAESYDEAVKMYAAWTKENELSDDTIEAYYQYAVTLEKASRPMEALPVYEQIARHNKSFMDVLIRLNSIKKATIAFTKPPVEGGDGTSAVPGGTIIKGGIDTGIPSDRYEILKELGLGGMGVVYKAVDKKLERTIALKLLSQDFSRNPTALKFFMREAQSAAQLNHPNIVTIYDIGTFKGRHFISMEYIDGMTLEEVQETKGKFAILEFLPIAEQVLSAMAYAHRRKVIHRDIKPANLMLTDNNKVAKIMDFGLAKVVDDRTKTTVIAGTPVYMPIEQTLGKNIDHRADIFALGVTFFEMLTGELPFPEGVAAWPSDKTPPQIRSLNPNIPKKLNEIVFRMIQRKSMDRYATGAETHRDVVTIIKFIEEYQRKRKGPGREL